MQGTQVLSLIGEDPLCHRVTKTMSHNYWSLHAWSLHSAMREANAMRSLCTTTKSNPCLLLLKKIHVHQRRPRAAKNKQVKYFFKENRIKALILFIITSKRISYLRICLTKERKDLYSESYTTLMKEFENNTKK